MCYDVSFTVNVKSLPDYFPDLVIDPQLKFEMDVDRTHIIGHDYNEHPIISRTREGSLLLRLMQWGCIPYYVKDLKSYVKQRPSMLNARSERILDDEKTYWYKVRNRRCLIPVNGTYEHRGIKGWKNKVPYFVKPKAQETFFLPGLYSVTELPDQETGEMVKTRTYTLITRAANEIMMRIHNDGPNKWRMPLFLPFSYSKKWLDDKLTEEEYRAILNYEMPSEDLEAWPVFTIRSQKPRPDGLPKNERYVWEALPDLETGEIDGMT